MGPPLCRVMSVAFARVPEVEPPSLHQGFVLTWAVEFVPGPVAQGSIAPVEPPLCQARLGAIAQVQAVAGSTVPVPAEPPPYQAM